MNDGKLLATRCLLWVATSQLRSRPRGGSPAQPDRAWHRARRRQGRFAPRKGRGGLRPSLTAAPRGAFAMFRPGRRNAVQPNKETLILGHLSLLGATRRLVATHAKQ